MESKERKKIRNGERRQEERRRGGVVSESEGRQLKV